VVRFPAAPRLSDGVVVLRGPRDADVEPLAAASLDPQVLRFTRVPDDNSPERVRTFLYDPAAALGAEESRLWVIADASEAALGLIDIRIERAPGRGDIGYWLGPAGRGRGLMTRAVTLLAAHGFDTLGLARVTIRVATENVASQAVAERAGFVREGVLRSYDELKGRREDHVVYSRLPTDA
jgi:RimJ/RimL family protein N-acetyltransferase